ncbi:MAG: response regulator [Candidatus Heimdallarchaeota archaeon]
MKSILIVDDNDKLRSIFKLMLKDYEVVEAQNGKIALEIVRKRKFNLVLMDILMPEMNGIIATQKILEIRPNLNILAITAYTSKANEILKAGAKEVLKKPIRKQLLLQKVEEYVN